MIVHLQLLLQPQHHQLQKMQVLHSHLPQQLSIATTADVTVALSTSGTGTEGTDYATISDITISSRDITGTASLLQQMIVCMKEMKRVLVAISSVSGADQLRRMELNQLQ